MEDNLRFTAEDARGIAKATEEKYFQDDYKKCKEAILKTVQSYSKFKSVTVYHELSAVCQSTLINEGFKLERFSDRDGAYWNISW